MLRSLTIALLVLAGTAWGPVPIAGADEPGPTVILGPPPFVGPDAMIRADGSSTWVGADTHGDGRIDQSITQLGRAVSYVRICPNTTSGRMQVEGTDGGQSFRVRYRVSGHDVTRSVVTGSYRTPRLRNACAPRIRVVVRLKRGAVGHARTVVVRATSPSGTHDSVSTHVSVVGPLVVP